MRALSRLLDLPYLLLAFAPLCWAGNLIVGRAVRGEIPPIGINWWRWAIAGAILSLFVGSRLWRQRILLARHWRLVGLLAATGITGFHSAVYIGLTQTTAINAALIIAMGPVFIVPLAWALLGERITMLQVAGVALSCLGATVVIVRGDPGLLFALRLNSGDLWLAFASFCWGAYSVLLKRKPADLEVLVLLTAILLAGTLMTTPLYLWEMAGGRFVPVTPESLAALSYVSLAAGVLAYIAWNRGVHLAGPNKAGLFLHLIPVYGAILAALLLGESLHGHHLAGVALIVAGLVLTTRFGPRPRSAQAGR